VVVAGGRVVGGRADVGGSVGRGAVVSVVGGDVAEGVDVSGGCVSAGRGPGGAFVEATTSPDTLVVGRGACPVEVLPARPTAAPITPPPNTTPSINARCRHARRDPDGIGGRCGSKGCVVSSRIGS
jgi:hypothetical protein